MKPVCPFIASCFSDAASCAKLSAKRWDTLQNAMHDLSFASKVESINPSIALVLSDEISNRRGRMMCKNRLMI